ncbi:unnamed protein product [Closterium sp. NIES-64]|nr:unnamed protein product [Closterium sp. NIES-64]
MEGALTHYKDREGEKHAVTRYKDREEEGHAMTRFKDLGEEQQRLTRYKEHEGVQGAWFRYKDGEAGAGECSHAEAANRGLPRGGCERTRESRRKGLKGLGESEAWLRDHSGSSPCVCCCEKRGRVMGGVRGERRHGEHGMYGVHGEHGMHDMHGVHGEHGMHDMHGEHGMHDMHGAWSGFDAWGAWDAAWGAWDAAWGAWDAAWGAWDAAWGAWDAAWGAWDAAWGAWDAAWGAWDAAWGAWDAAWGAWGTWPWGVSANWFQGGRRVENSGFGMPDLTDIESSTNESAAGEGGMAQGGAVVGTRVVAEGVSVSLVGFLGSFEAEMSSGRTGGRGGGQGGGWREGKGALGGDIKEGLEREPGGQEAARRRTGIVKEGDEGEEEGEDGMKGSEEGERGRDEGSIDWLRLSVGVAGCSKESQHQHTIDFMGSSCIDMNESEEDGCMPRGALLASPRGTDSARPRGTASASPRGAALAWPHATCQHALAGSPASSSDLRELVSRQQGQIEELRWLLGQQMEACHALAAALVLPVLTCVVPFEFLSVHSQELVARQQGQIEELRRLLGQQMESCHALAAALRLQQQERQHLGRQGEQGLGGLKETQEADLEETKLGESRSEEADGAEGEEGAEEAGGEREKEVRDSGGGEREGAREWRDLDWDDELMQQSGELRGDITSLKDQLVQRANRIASPKQSLLHTMAQLKSRSPSPCLACLIFPSPFPACSLLEGLATSHHSSSPFDGAPYDGSAQVPLSLSLF